MTTALIIHRVDDYDAWREAYDSVAQLRETSGVTDAQVLRPSGDDDPVAVTHEFPTAEAAREFLDNDELKGAMGRGGVDLDSLRIHLLERD